MSLEGLIRGGIEAVEQAFKDKDLEKFLSHYASNAVIVDAKQNKLFVGTEAITGLFKEWAAFGAFTNKNTNETFEGSEQIIRYSATSTITFEGGKTFVTNFVQYWRKVDGKYVVETDVFDIVN
ncbi:unnamed protein product, partial [Mesorhabditis spiculigera]